MLKSFRIPGASNKGQIFRVYKKGKNLCLHVSRVLRTGQFIIFHYLFVGQGHHYRMHLITVSLKIPSVGVALKHM